MGFFSDQASIPIEVIEEEEFEELPEEANDEPKRGTFLTLSELARIPPPMPLVRELINLDSITMLVGASRAFKSFLTIGISCAIAHPTLRAWEGYEVVEHGTVAYIAAEGGTGLIPRVEAWCRANRVDRSEIEDTLLINRDAIQLTSMDDMEYLLQQLGLMPNLRMVVIDTKARTTAELDENSATDQAKAIEIADYIKRVTGASIIIIHHTGKDGHGARGSSAWIGAVDTELTAERDGDEMMTTMTCTKRKDDKDGCEHRFEMKEFEFGDFFGKTKSLVAIAMRDDEDSPGGSTMNQANDEKALNLLTSIDDGTGSTRAAWTRLLMEDGASEISARTTTGRLIRHQRVNAVGGKGAQIRYTTKGM